MMNPEIWVWLRTAVWGNDIQRPLDANRNELCDQLDVLRSGFLTRIGVFSDSARSEKYVEVDSLIVALEHSLKQILVGAFCRIARYTHNTEYETRRMDACSVLSKFSIESHKQYEKHINALRVFRKLIHRETLGDHMSEEYREMARVMLRYLKKIEKLVRKVAAILFRKYKEAVKNYHRMYEKVRLRIEETDSVLKSPPPFSQEQLTEWARKNPDAFNRMVYDIRNGE